MLTEGKVRRMVKGSNPGPRPNKPPPPPNPPMKKDQRIEIIGQNGNDGIGYIEDEIFYKRLREYLYYNKGTGTFTWIKTKHYNSKKDTIAGSKHSAGYIEIGFDGKRYLAHRLAWYYVFGQWPKDKIDHINGIKDDNRWENLRESNQSTNAMNSKKQNRETSSIYKGVSFDKYKNKYHSYINKDGIRYNLGYFNNEIDAAKAYNNKAIELFGEFAMINNIKEERPND